MGKGVTNRFNPAKVFAYGTMSAAIAVALGAFGAHGLKGALTPDRLAIFDTAARYQMYHALAMIAAGLGGSHWAAANPRNFVFGGWCFAFGTVLFSGSLYVLSVSHQEWVAFVTPLGGVLFIAGWIFLFVGVLKDCRAG